MTGPGPRATPAAGSAARAVRVVRVVRGGALTTFQDAGRAGLAHLGVPRSGAMDPEAHALANRLAGNAEGAPVLETTVDGVGLAFDVPAVVTVTGAPAPVTVDGRDAGWGLAVDVPAGGVLEVGRATAGVRSYVAVAGGWVAEPVLGSVATDVLSGLGPRPLATGDSLAVGRPARPAPAVEMAPWPLPAAAVVLSAHPGPRMEWLAPADRRRVLSSTWRVSPASNRIALRLDGQPLERARDDELPSEGMVWGAVQLLPDGTVAVMLADHPTTGGYPVVVVVDRSAAPACAQARPGSTVLLRPAGAPGPEGGPR